MSKNEMRSPAMQVSALPRAKRTRRHNTVLVERIFTPDRESQIAALALVLGLRVGNVPMAAQPDQKGAA